MDKKIQYDIIGFCSENYKACDQFSIESWLATKARKIYIYTDGWTDDNRGGRIVFVNITEKESEIIYYLSLTRTTINIKAILFMVEVDFLLF